VAVAHTRRTLTRLLDIRNIIGALLAVYGVLLTLAGFVPAMLPQHNDPAAASNRADLYIGTAANWWVGLVLIGLAIGFVGWAVLRPLQARDSGAPGPDSGGSGAV
jgi:hypothetical protein